MILKFNNKALLREACRETANRFRPGSEAIKNELTDGSSVVKNHPDDVKPFVEQLRFALNKDAFEYVGVQAIIDRLPKIDATHKHLCVYDFYKALRDSKYFAIERALKRIRQFGERKEGMKFTRKNARGHYTCAVSPTAKAYAQSFCSEFNHNWRMILTLGSRLCHGSDRELHFKTDRQEPLPYLDAKMIPGCDNHFTIRVVNHAPAKTVDQLQAFLNATNPGLFHYVHIGNAFNVTVRAPKVIKPLELSDFKQVPLPDDVKDSVLKGNWSINKADSAFIKFIQPEMTPVEDHFYSEMEKSVNELSVYIDELDKQIDELEAKTSKFRAQRSKLLAAMQALR